MTDQIQVPKAGDRLTSAQIEEILEAARERSENFPDEPSVLTFVVVMLNIGDRFTPVECVNGEWSGIKMIIPRGNDMPKCPNGHVLTQGPGITLGWVDAQ